MSAPIIFEVQDGVAIVTLNRPETGNAIGQEMSEAFFDLMPRLKSNKAIRSILLQAEGPYFCVGGDIALFAESISNLRPMLEKSLPVLHRFMSDLKALDIPIVTALQGGISGGGIGLGLSGDIVIASSSMKLRGGYSAIGLTPDLGSSWFLTRRVGPSKAKDIFFRNKFYSAEACLRIGAIDFICAEEAIRSESLQMAKDIAAMPARSIRRIKQLVDSALANPLQSHLDSEEIFMLEASSCSESAEGIRAFIEKRAPAFNKH